MDRQDHKDFIRENIQNILAGDPESVAKQHALNKMTARERVNKLFDLGSFVETDALIKESNVVTGYGTILGRVAYCFAQDMTVSGGAMSEKQAQKVLKLLNLAKVTGAPVVALIDSVGAKVLEGVHALSAYAKVFAQMVRLSGVCPMIACVMGPCRGVMTMLTKIADISIVVDKTGEIELNAPLVLGKKLSAKEMAAMGAVSLVAENEDQAMHYVATLLDYLPSCNVEDAPMTEGENLNRVLSNVNEENGLDLAFQIADDNKILELGVDYGKAVHTILCRVGGRTTGIIATDYTVDNGRLDPLSCEKAARFIRLLDCFQLQIVTLVNSDGLQVMGEHEQAWSISSASQLLYAYAEATTGKIALFTGNAIGSSYVALGGKNIADIAYAFPSAMVAPLTEEVAVQTLCDEQLSAGANREDLQNNYRNSTDALYAAQEGIVDDVIEPENARKHIIFAMEALASKHDVNLPKKHGNMPV